MGTKYYIYLLTWTSYSCFRYYVTVKWNDSSWNYNYGGMIVNKVTIRSALNFEVYTSLFFYHKLVFGIEKNSNTTAMKVNIFLYIQNSLSKKGKYSLNMASPSILLKIKLASVSKLWNLCYWTWSIVSCMEENLFFPIMKRFKARIKRKYWNLIEATYHL